MGHVSVTDCCAVQVWVKTKTGEPFVIDVIARKVTPELMARKLGLNVEEVQVVLPSGRPSSVEGEEFLSREELLEWIQLVRNRS